ncbi:LysR family transcriptional regulator [Lasiodiplodia theobromae]|uniref:LysR family transcriptional regulator n=1 Tax=Lasiodiplodia theobromae TaxID=45133 RepID=UPI0015C39683|nr:LysR family transcriptional regulator [Lasiodiplodia theobromae]KAF4539728.1 LysR family transcriptional regulator [Lasiodiplodia theobromae]
MQVLSKVAGDFFIVFTHALNMSDHINVISNDGYERSLAGTRTEWDALGDVEHAEYSDFGYYRDIRYDWASSLSA